MAKYQLLAKLLLVITVVNFSATKSAIKEHCMHAKHLIYVLLATLMCGVDNVFGSQSPNDAILQKAIENTCNLFKNVKYQFSFTKTYKFDNEEPIAETGTVEFMHMQDFYMSDRNSTTPKHFSVSLNRFVQAKSIKHQIQILEQRKAIHIDYDTIDGKKIMKRQFFTNNDNDKYHMLSASRNAFLGLLLEPLEMTEVELQTLNRFFTPWNFTHEGELVHAQAEANFGKIKITLMPIDHIFYLQKITFAQATHHKQSVNSSLHLSDMKADTVFGSTDEGLQSTMVEYNLTYKKRKQFSLPCVDTIEYLYIIKSKEKVFQSGKKHSCFDCVAIASKEQFLSSLIHTKDGAKISTTFSADSPRERTEYATVNGKIVRSADSASLENVNLEATKANRLFIVACFLTVIILCILFLFTINYFFNKRR